jgi:hypothetical protein
MTPQRALDGDANRAHKARVEFFIERGVANDLTTGK